LFAGAVEAVFAVVVGAADMGVVAAASVEPVGDDVLGWVALGWVALGGGVLGWAVLGWVAAAAEGPAVDATAGVAAAVGGIDTGAGGPIWLDGA
jgi:hypothetical protein